MSHDNRILNLDDLTGQSRPVIVQFQGKRYELKRPEGLTLKQSEEWHRFGAKLLGIYGPNGNRLKQREINNAMINELSEAVDGCLRLICPAILDEEKPVSFLQKLSGKAPERHPFTFDQKLQVLDFYSNEVFRSGGAKSEPAKKSTGARHSHG